MKPKSLVIRKEQVSILDGYRHGRFEERLQHHLLHVLGPSDNSYQIIEKAVEEAVSSAGRFGLRTEAEVARFVEICCLHLGGLEDKLIGREALEILHTSNVPKENRLDRYEQWARSKSDSASSSSP